MFGADVRRIVLAAHVVVSVSWIGAVACFLALAIAGISSKDPQLARSAYRAMQLTTWVVIVPAAAMSLLSGIVSSLTTNWGLLRHWWVMLKLAITLFATAVLLVHTQPIDLLASATQSGRSVAEFPDEQQMMVIAAAGAMIVLIVLTVLSIFKPRGATRYAEQQR